MAEQDLKLTFTEEEFRAALFDAFMEGRVHANWEFNRDDDPTPSDYFDQLYSGDKQGWGPNIIKIRKRFTTQGDG